MNENPQVTRTPGNPGLPLALGFVVGALVGAGVALLLAPESGKETRQRLTRTGERLGNAARTGLDQVLQTANGLREDAQSAMEAGREKLAHAVKSQDSRPVSRNDASEIR